jgi:flagellar biosynthesis/type III secretory pathway protein FliH
VLGAATAPPPAWLHAQHLRVAQFVMLKARETQAQQAAKSAASSELESQLREQIEALEAACGQLQHAAQTMQIHWQQIILPEVQKTVIELAHAIAAKLVLDQVQCDQFPIENLVREVVGRLNTDQTITVKLNPADFSVWQQHVASHVSATTLGEQVRVQADKHLARGDCQAVAGEVSIVYELQRQIEELRVQLVS